MPANPPYIPAPDADLDLWSANFNTLLTANPTNYGLVAGDATAVDTVVDAFHTAFLAATNPVTRTSVTVAAKDSAKAGMLVVVRPYAQRIAANPSVSDGLKTGIGVTVRITTRTPVPTPASGAELTLNFAIPEVVNIGYKNPDAPLGKAVPYGSSGVEIWGAFGTAYTSDPTTAVFLGRFSKSPAKIPTAGQAGKHLSLFGRFVNKGGNEGVARVGPFGSALDTIVL